MELDVNGLWVVVTNQGQEVTISPPVLQIHYPPVGGYLQEFATSMTLNSPKTNPNVISITVKNIST